jgi:hypothetical protein
LTTATANAASGRLRSERARQRRELRGAPPQELVRAIVHPTPELASYRLSALFGHGLLIRHFGPAKLELATRKAGCNSATRLRELSEISRRDLARAVYDLAPRKWKNP